MGYLAEAIQGMGSQRKIFLYPENWIEPELRDDKSPFFKELESKLGQNEITTETAEDAMRDYLEKLRFCGESRNGWRLSG